jgi:hypothetical protein
MQIEDLAAGTAWANVREGFQYRYWQWAAQANMTSRTTPEAHGSARGERNGTFPRAKPIAA